MDTGQRKAVAKRRLLAVQQLEQVKEEMRQRRHQSIPEQGKWLKQDRLSSVLRRADQWPDTLGVPLLDHRPLATLAPTAESEGLHDLGADHEAGKRLSPSRPQPPSVAPATLRRQTPEVGAECPNRACSDLCGGRSVMGVPTAIKVPRARTPWDRSWGRNGVRSFAPRRCRARRPCSAPRCAPALSGNRCCQRASRCGVGTPCNDTRPQTPARRSRPRAQRVAAAMRDPGHSRERQTWAACCASRAGIDTSADAAARVDEALRAAVNIRGSKKIGQQMVIPQLMQL
jgi:hypothetical protein